MEVAADSACQVGGSRRASFASIEGMPASAVTRNAPKNTIEALSPLPMTCTAAQIANDHSMGCRVTRVMPRGGRVVAPGGPIIVGFGWLTEATNRMNAGSIARTRIQRSQAGMNQSGSVGEALQARTRKMIAAIDRTEKTPRNGVSPMRTTMASRTRVPAMPTCTPTHMERPAGAWSSHGRPVRNAPQGLHGSLLRVCRPAYHA